MREREGGRGRERGEGEEEGYTEKGRWMEGRREGAREAWHRHGQVRIREIPNRIKADQSKRQR
jgi:hypothetical protein